MIMTEEIRMREEGFRASTSSALNMEGRESKNRNRNTNQWGRSKSRSKSKSRYQVNYSGNQQRNKKDVECWNCGKKCHFSYECRSEKKDKGKGSANCVSEESDDCLICSLESNTESWVLDSVASFHATPHRELFENYVSKNLGKVYLGDDQTCKFIKNEDLRIQLNGLV